MKKSKSATLLAALLLTVFVLTLLCACTPAEKDGVEIMGIASKDSYPVQITESYYKLSVHSFPTVAFYGGTYYSPHFTADYFFYNPTDTDCAMTLYSPAMLPRYAQSNTFYCETDYGVTVNGKEADVTSRYTLSYTGGSMSLLYSFDELRDDRILHDEYNSDCTVYKQTYTVSSSAPYVDVEFDVKYDDRVLFENQQTSVNTLLDTKTIKLNSVKSGSEITAFCVGELYDLPSCAKLTPTDGSGKPMDGVTDSLLIEQTPIRITFDDLAMIYYDAKKGISETDYYNAVINGIGLSYGISASQGLEQFQVGDLVEWKQFQVTVPAGGYATCQVTGPLFPIINADGSNDLYDYEINTTQYSKFADIGRMKVEVDTPYAFSADYSSAGIVSNDSGFTASYDKAQYTCVSLYDPEKSNGTPGSILSSFARSFWIAFFVLTTVFFVILPAVIVVIVLSVTRGKRRKNADKPSNARVTAQPKGADAELRLSEDFYDVQTTATKDGDDSELSKQ